MTRTLIVLATTLLVASVVQARPGSGEGFGHSPMKAMGGPSANRLVRRIERLADELGLSEAQLDQISSIVADAADGELREAIKANREAIAAASEFDSYDPALVAELAARQGELMAAGIVKMHDTKQDVLTVLTAEQRAELGSLRAERKARRAERRARIGKRWQQSQGG